MIANYLGLNEVKKVRSWEKKSGEFLNDEVSFIHAVKARLAKFDSTGSGKTNEEIETTVRQVIDKALVSEDVKF